MFGYEREVKMNSIVLCVWRRVFVKRTGDPRVRNKRGGNGGRRGKVRGKKKKEKGLEFYARSRIRSLDRNNIKCMYFRDLLEYTRYRNLYGFRLLRSLK